MGEVTRDMLSGLQTRYQWIKRRCCQAALDVLVQRQQALIGFHLLLQEMIQLGKQWR
jgi:hypothetical protein